MQESIQKCKVFNFFQSVHCLQFQADKTTTEQLNRNIALQSGNLYSLFELIVSVANSQIYSQKPLATYRRLMLLIHFICTQHQLYFSKLKALVRFWWESSLKVRTYFQKIDGQVQTKKIEIFQQRLNRDDFLLQTLKCFNILLRKINTNSKQSIKQKYLIKHFIDKSVYILERDITNHEEQTQYRIPLYFEYTGFLLQIYPFRKQKSETQELFDEYWKSILQIIRALKKFFNHSTPEHRQMLTNLIKSGRNIFKGDIPIHKLNLLANIINYVDRRQDKDQQILVKQLWDEKHKKIIIIISRILAQWKKINPLSPSPHQTALVCRLDEKKSVSSITNVVAKTSLEKNSESKQKKKNKNQSRPTFRKIHELKRKKIISLNFPQKYDLQTYEQFQLKDKLPTLVEASKKTRQRLFSSQTNLYKNEPVDDALCKEIQKKPAVEKVNQILQKTCAKSIKLRLIR